MAEVYLIDNSPWKSIVGVVKELSLSTLFIALLLSFTTNSCHAQKKGSFDFYLATPEKFLNQKITVYIMSVDLPAENATNMDEDFRVFKVYTSSQDGSNTSYSTVKILKSKADAFVARYNQSQGRGSLAYTPRNASAVFRMGNKEDPYLSGRFYLDMMGE